MVIPADIRELGERRDEARKRRDYDEADRLRSEIRQLGWDVEDTPDGPRFFVPAT
jgi:cysteinyl-tRNA synthetase